MMKTNIVGDSVGDVVGEFDGTFVGWNEHTGPLEAVESLKKKATILSKFVCLQLNILLEQKMTCN